MTISLFLTRTRSFILQDSSGIFFEIERLKDCQRFLYIQAKSSRSVRLHLTPSSAPSKRLGEQ